MITSNTLFQTFVRVDNVDDYVGVRKWRTKNGLFIYKMNDLFI